MSTGTPHDRPAARASSFRAAAARDLEAENARYQRRMEKQKKEAPPRVREGDAVGGDFAKQEQAKRDKAAWEKRRKKAAPNKKAAAKKKPAAKKKTPAKKKAPAKKAAK